jgi:hypothetical protein
MRLLHLLLRRLEFHELLFAGRFESLGESMDSSVKGFLLVDTATWWRRPEVLAACSRFVC